MLAFTMVLCTDILGLQSSLEFACYLSARGGVCFERQEILQKNISVLFPSSHLRLIVVIFTFPQMMKLRTRLKYLVYCIWIPSREVIAV